MTMKASREHHARSASWTVNDQGYSSLHAQPLASSIVSARSEVVLMPLFFSRLLSLRMSFASMLTLATSFTMHPILSLEFSSRYLSRVVFPANSMIRMLNQSHHIHRGAQRKCQTP